MDLQEIMSTPTTQLNREQLIFLSNNYRNEAQRGRLKEYFSSQEIAIGRCSTTKHTIIFSTPSETGTSFFRILEPLLAIYRFTDELNLIYTESLRPWHYNIADLIVQHRAGEQHSFTHKVMDVWPKELIRPFVIHNVDDNEFNLPKSHPMREIWLAQEKDKMSIYSLSRSDAIEITTRKMKSIMTPINRNVYITRNMYNWRLPQWNLEKHKSYDYEYWNRNKDSQYTEFKFFDNYDSHKDVVIGWAGLTSHFEDLKRMKPILKAIYDKYPNVKFILAGMALKDNQYLIKVNEKGEKTMEEIPSMDRSASYGARVRNLYGDFGSDRMIIYDALNLEDFGWFYSLFDIGISYVEHNAFNSAKSEIKRIEYSYYHGIPITSKFGGYDDLIENMSKANIDTNKFSCITETQSEWINKISYIVENYRRKEINDLANSVHQFVANEYDIDKKVEEKIALYKRFIEENTEKENTRMINDQYSIMYKRYEEADVE